MSNTYELIDESAPHCEWDTFVAGSVCDKPATKAIVQRGGRENGFHWAHLCDEHANPALTEVAA